MRTCIFIFLFSWLGINNLSVYAINVELLLTEKTDAYVNKYQHIAILEMERSGVPASIKMAQALLESGIGESELARKANNHFGIKCGGDWDGGTYYLWDDEEVKSCFRVFESPEASFIAHTEFLTNPKKEYRYGFLFDLDPKDYKKWANGLQKAGYATSKTYATKLISLIERLELYKLDYLSSNNYAVSDEELNKLLGVQKDTVNKDTIFVEPPVVMITVPDPYKLWENVEVKELTKNKFYINGVHAVYMQPNETLLDISKRYKIPTSKLIKFNELKGRRPDVGQHIFLDKKRKKYLGKRKIHLVQTGESLHDAAQRYGIQYKKLIAKNKLYKHKTPPVGGRIYLK